MARIEVAAQCVSCQTGTLRGKLNDGLDWSCTIERPLDGVDIGEPLRLEWGDAWLKLVVVEFAQNADRTTWIRAVDPTKRVAPFTRESFSGSEGSSLGRAIESRLAIAAAPPALYSLAPAVQVDVTLGDLLDHSAAEIGGHWWYGAEGLKFGAVDTIEVKRFGEFVARTSRGTVWRGTAKASSGAPPLPGESVAIASGTEAGGGASPSLPKGASRAGAALELTAHYLNDGWTWECAVGCPAAPRRRPPRASQFIDCQVASLAPFMVDCLSAAGDKLTTQATPLELTSHDGQVALRFPIAVGDRGLLQVETLGVAARAPRYWPLSLVAALPASFTIAAPQLIVECEKQTHHAQSVAYPRVTEFSIA